MSKEADKLIYRLAEAELDPRNGQVKRRGEELYLRPKPLQVLLYLIEQRPRLVTKEELLEQVWQGDAVTDDALVQSIVEIRKTLGDSSQQPRWIKTFPKTGYRFIGEVETISSALEVQAVTSVEIVYEEEWERGRGGEGGRACRALTSPQPRPFSASPSLPLSPSPCRFDYARPFATAGRLSVLARQIEAAPGNLLAAGAGQKTGGGDVF